MSSTLTNLEPHIYALRRAIIGDDFDTYMKLFKIWKLKLAGRSVAEREFIAKSYEYKVDQSNDDCEGCKI
ncbi:hypothetical protein [Vibrio alginolyticus]|uniref:hypothetical protein n=1 Tax=Vibrio alginolyticus TaxID=663 RepID=UPI001558D48F|nr:hypothetical protein [Vibrio alginolyticus]